MKSVIFILIINLLFAFICLAEDSQVPDSTLLHYLEHKNDGLRSSAVQLLGERKSNIAVEPLIQLLTVEKHPGIRIIISLALWKIGDAKALPVLQNLAKEDKDNLVRKVVRSIILRMRNK
jgi:HEAT repeat protein